MATYLNLPIDNRNLKLDDADLAFFRNQTGIESENALRAHIIAVQREADEIYQYPCIRFFRFAKLKIARLPAFGKILTLGRERKGAIFLDVGCCFGNEVRKVVLKGFPIEQVICTVLQAGFWDLGHKLFRSTQATFPAAFIPGDIFDIDFLDPNAPQINSGASLSMLKTLTPLRAQVSVIHASFFFHLFLEEQQRDAAIRIASLLSKKPGSIICGCHVVAKEGEVKAVLEFSDDEWRFRHTRTTWMNLWTGIVFPNGDANVETGVLEDVRPLGGRADIEMMWWIITRV